MSSIKKFAWSGAAVVLAAVLMLGIMVPRAQAVALVTGGTTTILAAPVDVLTAGPGAYVVMTPLVITGASGDFGTTGTYILALPAGMMWDTSVTATAVYTTAGVAAVTYTTSTAGACSATSCGFMVITNTTSAATGTVLTVTAGAIRATGNATASGGVTLHQNSTLGILGVPKGTVLFQVTVTAVTTGGTATRINLVLTANASACALAQPVSVSTAAQPADGSTGAQLCALVLNAVGGPVGGVMVTFTVSVGYVSTGTGKSTGAFTSSAGTATTNYRGAGNVTTTDTAVASIPALSLVATPLTISLTAPAGGTATKITILTPAVLGLAPLITNTAPPYSSPTTATNVAIQVTDASGLGVNGQAVQLTVDRGGLVANAVFTAFAATQTALQAGCTGTPARSIIVTTAATELLSPGGSATPGAGNFVVCTNQTDALGKITLTAQNITTSMPNATLSLAQAGRPAKINITADGSTITAAVVDAAGNRVADGTPVSFTISANVGAVSTVCTTTTNGTATTVVALVGATGNVLVSTNWNETGVVASGSTCTTAGSQTLAVNVGLPSGGLVGGPTAPAAGAGTISSGTVPATGFGLVVFGGGTTAQLVTASKCPAATAAFFATTAGGFVVYVPGTTIAAVNADFLALFPAGNIAAGTAFLGKCA